MAESAVASLILKLGYLLYDESQFLSAIKGDVEEVMAELERMRVFLSEADDAEVSSLNHQVWVKQVRDCAYDSEDIVDEFLNNIVYVNSGQLRDYACCVVHKLLSWHAKHGIASSLHGIKTRFQAIFDRNQRYNVRRHVESGSISTQLSIRKSHNPQEDALFQEKTDVVGIDESKRKLIKMLTSGEPTLKIIPVVGMGGLGKTTLVKQVYEDMSMRFKNHAWITVSRTYKLEDLLLDLIQQLKVKTTQPLQDAYWSKRSTVHLKQMVYAILKRQKYLVVLDDVWSIDAWKDIEHAFPRNLYNSRIILTTRNVEVASTSCTHQEHVYNLEPLSESSSWNLLNKKVFSQGSCPQHLVDVSTSILKKCAGLPLAIVAISGVLKDKIEEYDEWERVNEGIGTGLEDQGRLKSIYKILALSYHDLPSYLRPCLLYMSLFPEYHPIECTRLIRLWMAEGFIHEIQGRTLEEVGQRYLTELLNRNLIHVSKTTSDGRMKTCRIHDLLRDVIIMKTRDQNFAVVAKENSGQWPETIRRLSVHNNLPNIQQKHNFKRLRSLIMFEVDQPLSKASMPALFSGGLKMITALDLQGTSLSKFPAGICKLFNLKYLSLKKTQVKKIPSSISKLKKLETLDLKWTRVSKLPRAIRKLKRLRSLLVYHYDDENTSDHSKHGFKAPKGIGGLNSLQKLCFVEAGQGSKTIVEEVGKLTELRRLCIIQLNKENASKLCTSIDKLSKLQALSITSSPDTVMDLNGITNAPKSLHRLYLNGELESFPSWIKSLDRLEKIYLKFSKLKESPLNTLGNLPNLVHVEFHQVYTGEELIFKAGKFQKLKTLGLHEMLSLETLSFEKTSMPSLEKLVIRSCSSLKETIEGIEHLPKLSELEFIEMPIEFVRTIQPKLKHNAKVHTTNMVNGVWETVKLSPISTETDSSKEKCLKESESMRTITTLEDKFL